MDPELERRLVEALELIGRAWAVQTLQVLGVRGKAIGEQAQVLSALGLSNETSAEMLGTTKETVRVELRNRLKPKAKVKGAKAGPADQRKRNADRAAKGGNARRR